MVPRAKAARSLPSPEADIDDLICAPGEHQPSTTNKRPRGRPPGASNKVKKPVPRKTRGSSKTSKAAVAASARQLRRGQKEASEADLELSRQPSRYGTVEKQAGHSQADSGSAGTSRAQLRPSEKSPRRRMGVGKPVAPEDVSKLGSTTMEIPATQEMDIVRYEESEDELPVLDEHLTADFEARPANSSAANNTDPASVRRRLGDVTKSYENLQMRHRDLREVGVRAAERNFDRLKKQAAENVAASNRIIAQLKEDIAAQSELIEEGQSLQHRLECSEASNSSLQADNEALKAALSEARNEISTLSTKLNASRSFDPSASVSKTRKTGTAGYKGGDKEIIQLAQAKEDLYSDLTGLIVRGLRRGKEEDMFDCIQTGRNGSLHFKLALEHGSDSYEDVQLTYRPQLDADRDCDLMELLPDYLVEEITFPRSHASKFYSRVIKSLSERTE